MNRSLFILIFLLFILSFFSLLIGVEDFVFIELLKGNEHETNLALISRIPRLISILVTGAGLSISGVILQTITNNKFVSPTTAGMMEWAKFGILVSIIFFANASSLVKMSVAFIFTIGGTMLFMKIVYSVKHQSSVMIPLIGIMLGAVVTSITTFVAYRLDLIQNIHSWLQGSFSLVVKGKYEILYIGIPFLFIAYIYANKFTIAGMGRSFATNLGLNHSKIVFIGLIISSIITSVIVVSIGSIPFVGLIVPNIVSIYRGDNLKNTLFESAVLGALFVLICDIVGRVIIYPYEISVSIVSGFVGSFIFLYLIFRGYKNANR